MDYRKLKRDANVMSAWTELPDGTVFTSTACRVVFPVNYAEHQLAFIGEEVSAIGYLAVIFPEKQSYAVMSACTLVTFSPAIVNVVKIFDEDYYELVFDPGTTVIPTVNCVMDDVLPYRTYNHFIAHARIPWYFGFLDVVNLFTSCPHYTGVFLAANESVMSLIASDIARNPENPALKYCTAIESIDQQWSVKPYWIPFKDIQYGATNTTARIMGSYADLAVTSALVNPSTRNENIEELLRQ
jgi:hypothetical protein